MLGQDEDLRKNKKGFISVSQLKEAMIQKIYKIQVCCHQQGNVGVGRSLKSGENKSLFLFDATLGGVFSALLEFS